MWFSLHSMAGAYPRLAAPADRWAAADLFHALPRMLPCATCGSNYAADLHRYPVWPHTAGRHALQRYVYDLHARVNVRLGKEAQQPPFEAVRASFDDGGAVQRPAYVPPGVQRPAYAPPGVGAVARVLSSVARGAAQPSGLWASPR